MLSILLFPLALLYSLVVRVRNFLYDLGWKRSYSFDQAVISVGNLSVGGTGKTPMIEYLVNLFSEKYSMAILSRGYGRNTHGFLLAEMHDDATTIGDEPFQFYRKYERRVAVAVCESRVEGIHRLMKKKPGIQVILLDDAFQHRAVRPLCSVLLTDFSKPFFTDHVLPMGRLREPRRGSSRSDVVIMTKCTALSGDSETRFTKSIQDYAGPRPVFFSGIGYKTPVAMDGAAAINQKIVLVSGIANSKALVDYVSTNFNMVNHFRFNDHHSYSAQDVELIQRQAHSGISILTTEKDLVKLIAPALSKSIDKKLWFYLPIDTHFLKNGSEFDMLITEKIKTHLKSRPTKI